MENNTEPDYDDPLVEEQWCEERQREVKEYLACEGVDHGRIGEWPDWHLAPYVSVWAIESGVVPESVGWWVICGDLPCDYVSAQNVHHPREALVEIAGRWREVARCMERGEAHPSISIGPLEEAGELAPLLQSRANVLEEWANEDELWEEDDR